MESTDAVSQSETPLKQARSSKRKNTARASTVVAAVSPVPPTSSSRDVNVDESTRTTDKNSPLVLSPPAAPLQEMDLALLVRNFAVSPQHTQAYTLLKLLRKTPATTLQMISTILLPALKRDIIGQLPREISATILQYLDIVSLCRCSQVSKRWRKVVDGDAHLWRRLIMLEGWEERSKRDLEKAYKRSQHPHTQSPRMQGMSTTSMELHGSPSMATLMTTPSSSLLYPQPLSTAATHPYKQLCARYHVIRRNWYTGRAVSTTFPAHGNDVVTCLYFDDDKIVSGSDDHCVNVTDVASGTLRHRLVGHQGGVWCLEVVGKNKNTLVTGSTDRSLRIWDMERAACTHVYTGHRSTIRCLCVIPKPAGLEFPNGT